jgi:glycine cleavage system transcriptional repressor
MEQLMVISAVGGEPTAVVQELTRVILDCGGNIKESRMASFGSEVAMLLLVSGNWHTISRMERELNRFASNNGVTMQFKRTEPGIVHSLSGFFAARKVEIAEVSTRSYAATHTGAPMFSVQMAINIPASVHISGLREEFMDFCDQLNVDAILEPVKHS